MATNYNMPVDGTKADGTTSYWNGSSLVTPYAGTIYYQGQWMTPSQYNAAVLAAKNLSTQLQNSGVKAASELADYQAKLDANQVASVAGNRLSALLSDPNSVADTPAYKFALEQGLESVNRTAAAKGQLASGNRLADLTKYGSGLAAQTYNQTVSNLGNFLNKQPLTQSSNTYKVDSNGSTNYGGTY